MALKRSRNCLPLTRTISATSMAGLLMNDVADDRARLLWSTLASFSSSIGLATWCRRCSDRCRYRAVTSRSSWPSRSWMVRRSVPASSRCVAQLCRTRCGRDSLADAGPLGSFGAGTPHDLVRNRLFAVAMQARGEQVGLRLEPAPVSTQSLQQRRAQRQVTILAALAVDDVEDHTRAVDVG